MARHNLANLTGFVIRKPEIHVNDQGEFLYALCTISVVRGYREVGDKKLFMKSDNPIIMSNDPSNISKMSTWEENDIVQIKGVIAVKTITKSNTCVHCGEINKTEGALVYINPIYSLKLAHCNTQEEAINMLSELREISNQIYVIGTLCRDPKTILTKEGLTITQYQIALNRKYFIRSDPPEIRSDYPWVKSYGDHAKEDRLRLHTGSVVFVDGCIQARSVQKHIICESCGQEYTWKDRAMEIVPYDTEYLRDYYTDEDLMEMERASTEVSDTVDEEIYSTDLF